MTATPKLPQCFADKIVLDDLCAEPVVDIRVIKQRRLTRRLCQGYFFGPAMGGPQGGGTPIALTA